MTRIIEGTGLPPQNSIGWADGRVRFIDQRYLPKNLRIVETDNPRVIARAIESLSVRGAPLIGISAAYGVAVAASNAQGKPNMRKRVSKTIDMLAKTRPTAVNLFWALQRMRRVLEYTGEDNRLATALIEESRLIHEDDRRRCEAMAKHGLELVGDNCNILTICNTGFLATGGIGTALGIIYRAYDSGRNVHVYSCETRPLLQGARLTVWELTQANIPVTLLVDSAASSLIRSGAIDMCIIGSDRIATNGDVVNKIGSYQLALTCNAHEVPFYVAAPLSTVDYECTNGDGIEIEQRPAAEVANFAGRKVTVKGTQVWNPAFDLVPANLVDAIITESGIYRPPYRFNT